MNNAVRNHDLPDASDESWTRQEEPWPNRLPQFVLCVRSSVNELPEYLPLSRQIVAHRSQIEHAFRPRGKGAPQ